MINLKNKDSVASKVEEILQQEALKGQQHQIDKNKNKKIDAQDFAILRGEKKAEVKEAAKPDFLDMDKDGDKKEPMKQAVKQAKMKKEEVESVEEGNNPFDVKNYKSQIPTKPGEKAGFDSKKTSTGTVYSRKPVKDDTMKKEEVEQIDELKKTTVKSYIKKKMDQVYKTGAPPSMGHVKKTMTNLQRAHDRNTGVKPTSENVALTLKTFKEQYENNSIYDQMIQEVLSKDASAGDWIHDFVHSDNPKFSGKSKEMRKKMALAAYYAKQRNEEVEGDICPECMQDPCVCGGNHVEEEIEKKK